MFFMYTEATHLEEGTPSTRKKEGVMTVFIKENYMYMEESVYIHTKIPIHRGVR